MTVEGAGGLAVPGAVCVAAVRGGRLRRRVVGVLVLSLGLAGCGTAGQVVSAVGEQQWSVCAGPLGAAPAVVLVHGIGDHASSASFERVMGGLVDAGVRVCRYDRPGTGHSPRPARAGRDADALTAELGVVVDQARPQGSVVLVARSFGSYPALAYATSHPSRVAGLVLVDAVNPRPGLLPALGVSVWSEVEQADEQLDLDAVQRQVAAATAPPHPLGGLPLVVLRRGRGAGPEWVAQQQDLARLSINARLLVAADSGHEVPADAPRTVIDATRDSLGHR